MRDLSCEREKCCYAHLTSCFDCPLVKSKISITAEYLKPDGTYKRTKHKEESKQLDFFGGF
jgi:hypothetical protein